MNKMLNLHQIKCKKRDNRYKWVDPNIAQDPPCIKTLISGDIASISEKSTHPLGINVSNSCIKKKAIMKRDFTIEKQSSIYGFHHLAESLSSIL